MDIIVFGTGEYYNNQKKEIANLNIKAFIDNNRGKQGSILDGKMIYAPEEIVNLDFDFVVVLSKHKKEMTKQLLSYGVDSARITSDIKDINYFYRSNSGMEAYLRTENVKEIYDCVIFSNGFSLTGAPIVLFEMAKILKTKGLKIIVVSNIDGEQRKRYLDYGIPVLIVPQILENPHILMELINKSQFLIVNTIIYENIVSYYLGKKKILWWVHEADEFYAEDKCFYTLKKNELIKICPVSEEAAKILKKNRGLYFDAILQYGIPDLLSQGSLKKDELPNKYIFTIVGTICRRKGHDIFLRAAEFLTRKYKDKVEFRVVGGVGENDLYEELKKFEDENENFHITGELPIESLLVEYNKMTALICPSRRDPLPVVITETMCLGKVAVVSNSVGYSKYLKDGVNSLLFSSEEEEKGLISKIEWLMMHLEEQEEIGKNARIFYENEFSLEVFDKNLVSILSDLNIDLRRK